LSKKHIFAKINLFSRALSWPNFNFCPRKNFSDILSHHNKGIDGILQEKKDIKYLSQQQAEDILTCENF
jgi:hypothetical protein